jgi:hypothetical protein
MCRPLADKSLLSGHIVQDGVFYRTEIGIDGHHGIIATLVDCRIRIFQAVTGQGTDNAAAFRDLA